MASVKSAAASTATVTVNAAFFQEIKEVNQELYDSMERIRRQLSVERGPVDEEQSSPDCQQLAPDCRKLAEQLANLRDQLALHFALEEAYGYFEDPVFVAPRLSNLAGSLRKDHKRLYLQINRLVDQVEQLVFLGRMLAAWPRIRDRFEQFHEQLQTHEDRENELILEAYDDDLGVGD